MAEVRALRGKIVVRRDKAEEKIGVIDLPTVAIRKPLTGTILHVGPPLLTPHGVEIPTLLSVGEVVAFHSHSGAEFVVDDETLLLLAADDVLAVITR